MLAAEYGDNHLPHTLCRIGIRGQPLRNHVIHGYDDVDCDIVWDVLHTHAPRLTESIPAIIATEAAPGKRD